MTVFGTQVLYRPIVVLVAVLLAHPATPAIVTKPAPKLAATAQRHLVDKYQFTTDSYFDSRTGVLRQYMEELLSSQGKGDPSIAIRSVLDSDNTYTTGNADRLISIDRLTPTVDTPAINQKVFDVARRFQTHLKGLLDFLSPDVFSEDPNVFLGENWVYFSITKKRGIVFYYLSRLLIYGVLVFLVLKFVFGTYKPLSEGVGVEDLSKERPGISRVQFWLLVAALAVTGLMFEPFFQSKALITQSLSDMMFKFKEIRVSIGSVIQMNNEINGLKVKVPGADDARFWVQTPLTSSIELADRDIQIMDSFLTSFTAPEAITNPTGPLAIGLLIFLVLGLHQHADVKRSPKVQFGVFALVVVTLALTFRVLEGYIAGFSAINDFCLSMMRYGNQPVYPFQGIGVSKLLGCSVQNGIFQQLYVNLIAQNAALKVFNNEMFVIGRKQVQSTDEALEAISFLQRLESSNPRIDRLATLMKKNNQVIMNLLQVNGCSPIKTWINNAQKDVCLTASHSGMRGFVLLLLLAAVLIALLFVSYAVFQAMIRKQTGSKVSAEFGQKEFFKNQVGITEQ